MLLVGLLLLLSGRYGPHRDELYFVAAGHHLALGYPDQPPLTPLVARIADELAHGNLLVLRSLSAVAAGLVAFLSGLVARELGGGRGAQLLTALTVGTGGVILAVGHLLSTSTLDVLAWVLVLLLVLRPLGRDAPRWWLAAGVVAGIGLENKFLVGFLLAGLAVGVVLSPVSRHHLRSRWLWAGVAAAVLLALPTLAWQATHGWPQLEVSADINTEYRSLGQRIYFVAEQLIMFSPLAGVLWVFGLVQLFRRPSLAWARPVATAYVVLLVVFAVTGGKGYYLAGIIPVLVAAGCVVLEERWSPRGLLRAGVALFVVAAVAWPLALPLLPARTFAGSIYSVPGQDQLETIGWPGVVDQVRGVLREVPTDERASALVVTRNYGEAGALSWYRVGAPVFSGHNGWAAWGPPPEGTGPVVVVGYDEVDRWFTGCRSVATLDTGVDNEEDGKPVWLCTAPRGSWAAIWPKVTHLDG